jgi:hypothetical protein
LSSAHDQDDEANFQCRYCTSEAALDCPYQAFGNTRLDWMRDARCLSVGLDSGCPSTEVCVSCRAGSIVPSLLPVVLPTSRANDNKRASEGPVCIVMGTLGSCFAVLDVGWTQVIGSHRVANRATCRAHLTNPPPPVSSHLSGAATDRGLDHANGDEMAACMCNAE